MIKYLFSSVVAICFTFSPLSAQSAKSVYVELGGPGLASVNYDMRFTGGESGIGGRIGIGGIYAFGAGITTIPIGLNYLFGNGGSNYFELGAGYTPVIASSAIGETIFAGSFGHIHFGYRLQPQDNGFTFRAGITPLIGQGIFFPFYGSISFGYKF